MCRKRATLAQHDGVRGASSCAPQSLEIMLMVQEKLKRKRASRSSDMDDPNVRDTTAPSTRSASLRQLTTVNAVPTLKRHQSEEPAAVITADLDKSFSSGTGVDEYHNQRRALVDDEYRNSWSAPARKTASKMEFKAQNIVRKIREYERTTPTIYGNLPGETIPSEATRDMGGQFLVNKPRIDHSRLFKIAHRIPKGSHNHLHFNSEIPPEVLLPLCRDKGVENTMCVRCSRPLLQESDYRTCEIVFEVRPIGQRRKADIFTKEYDPAWKHTKNYPWMLWKDFRDKFPLDDLVVEMVEGLDRAESWARGKMIVTLDDAYHDRQTHNGAWACFNQGTRAFKGLIGYESAYRWYVGKMIESMVRDRVMYAELRPMLLDKTIPSDDGMRLLDHKNQMQIISEEVAKKQKKLNAAGNLDQFPFGVKIIYCTPRSIPREMMKNELADCLQLKIAFPDLICGFDLVGAEDRPNSIGFYADLLVAFQRTCNAHGLSIPFMFHAGETLLDTGGSQNPENSNLYDALLLNSKRIGHGYALLKHPILVEKYKRADICLELCPISNELLHLCGNARQHPFPQLLAAGLPCTLNADNPSLFSSSLSYEFYQVMVGDPRMDVHGWRQLAEWSLQYSCLPPQDLRRALEIHAHDWEEFCTFIVATYGPFADELTDIS